MVSYKSVRKENLWKIDVLQDGNHLTSGYVDYMFPRLPFLTVKAVLDNEEIIAVTPNSVEIRNTIKNVFPKILHVSKSIPVMQNYVFQSTILRFPTAQKYNVKHSIVFVRGEGKFQSTTSSPINHSKKKKYYFWFCRLRRGTQVHTTSEIV